MKLARRLTALAAIGIIFIGGILETTGSGNAEPLILTGVLVLILVYIPIFLLHISKKWEDEDNPTIDQHNQ